MIKQSIYFMTRVRHFFPSACMDPRRAAGGPGGPTLVETGKRITKKKMKHFLAYPSPAVYAINKARHERGQRDAHNARSPGNYNNRSSATGSSRNAGDKAPRK